MDARPQEGARFEFDSAGRSTSHRDLNGNSITITRNAQGLPATIVDDSGRTVLTFTTEQGHITRVTDLVGRTVDYEYDGDDLVRVTDAAGKIWTFTTT
jgi:YD repeat-containing protein